MLPTLNIVIWKEWESHKWINQAEGLLNYYNENLVPLIFLLAKFTDVKNTSKYFNADRANWYIKWFKGSLADVIKYARYSYI